jgi:hypothetical protein
MAEETMFRFLHIRPGRRTERDVSIAARIPLYPEGVTTPFADSVGDLQARGASKAELRRVVNAFRQTDDYKDRLEGLPIDLTTVTAWLAANGRRDLSDGAAGNEFAALWGQPLNQLVAGSEFRETLLRLADSLYAEGLVPSSSFDREAMTAARKLMAIAAGLAGGGTLPATGAIGRWIDGMILLMPRPRRRTTPVPPEPAPTPPPVPPKPVPDRGKRLADLEHAHRELSKLAVDESAIHAAAPTPAAPARMERVAAAARAGESPTRDLAARPEVSLRLTPDAVNRMSDTTRHTLSTLKLDTSRLHPTGVVGALEDAMLDEVRGAGSSLATNSVIRIGGVLINRQRLLTSLGMGGSALPMMPPVPLRCGFEAGIGDLLLVRQTIKAYELGEFAHVENVLAGESRLREHRRLDLREEIEAREEERETEKERDLQSTERNETQAEAEKTVKSQLALEAGLQVSGSYGPSTSFTSNFGTTFSTSTEESQRKAVSYSREVSEKTAERVRERVKTELRRRTLAQTEELNRHGIENLQQGAKHVRGIYRWLNKVYDAQIMNYGQRMMYEFVLPEPAAYFLYATIDNPPAELEIIKPDPPTFWGVPLRPSNLTRTNYVDWVAQYQVRNVPPPPPQFQHVTFSDKQDKTEDGSIFGRASKIAIPPGYEAYAATVASDYSYTEGKIHAFAVMLGGTNFDVTPFWGNVHKPLDLRYSELSVAVHVFEAWSFTLGIDVFCRLTAEGFAKWQQAVYDSIMEAYLQQKADYDSSQKAAAIQQGIPILGRNPLENRRLERDELKKLALMTLTGSVTIERDSMQATSEPFMDLDKVCDNGAWVRFFENAFEWNNILYVFYPYFWGRHARWISAIHFTDPDPDFAAFLKAGAARMQVPVRPGFEKAVAYFVQTGEIWEGNDPPLIDDDLYVPLVDEISENLGKLDDGVPYPEGSEPWEVRIPTSLVVVQNLEEIPNIRDVLTGQNIVLG